MTKVGDEFQAEAACMASLEAMGSPDGFCCLVCGGRETWPMARGRLVCATAGVTIPDALPSKGVNGTAKRKLPKCR